MPSLDNSYNAASVFVDVPGRPDQVARVWRLRMQSSSDTVTVPELLTRSGSNDQSSVRVLDPATGVTTNAAATTSNNENVVTVASSSAGSEVVLFTLHPRNARGTVAPDPS
jgi:hypothetical protein